MGNQSSRKKAYKVPPGAGKPGSPSKPTVEYIGDDVMVRWNEPLSSGGCPIIGYVLQFNRVDGDIWESYRVDGTECLLKNLDDTFVFRVVAENLVGYSDPSETSVPVSFEFSEPVLLVPLSAVTRAIEFEKVEFTCRIWGMPNPELTWYLNGDEILPSNRIFMHTDGIDYKLVFNHIKISDDGELRAVARNLLGEIDSTATIVVEAPPRIKSPKNYDDGIICRVGETLRLKFGTAGRPKPEIAWYHEGELLNGRFKLQEIGDVAILSVESVTRNDAGEYTIRVENSIGEDIAHVLVTVIDRPIPPEKPIVIQLSDNSCLLEWEPLNEDVTAYIVEYFRDGWGVWLKALSTKHRGCKIRDLIPGSKYRFRIRAENHFGTSDGGEESVQIYIPESKKEHGSVMSSIQEDEFEVVGELQPGSSFEKLEQIIPPIPDTRKPKAPYNKKLEEFKPEITLPSSMETVSEPSFKMPSPRAVPNKYESLFHREVNVTKGNELKPPEEKSTLVKRPASASPVEPELMTKESNLFRRNQLIGNPSPTRSYDSLRTTPSPQPDIGTRYFDHYSATSKKARGMDRFEKYRKDTKPESSPTATSLSDTKEDDMDDQSLKENSFIIVEDAEDCEDESAEMVVSQLVVPVKSGNVKISTSFDNGSFCASVKSSMDDLHLSFDQSRNPTPDYLSSSPLPHNLESMSNRSSRSNLLESLAELSNLNKNVDRDGVRIERDVVNVRGNPSASTTAEECRSEPSQKPIGAMNQLSDNEPVPGPTDGTPSDFKSLKFRINRVVDGFIVLLIFSLLGPLLFTNVYTLTVFCLLLIKMTFM
ncbi:unnamed protein product [Allacma fusca]|uniref:Uncharacterized protein n=1 Tax=Allacma fusca TaxID=39272 RepID=A0A8J2LNU5_9HEXA|nr:unnamed protein product [Allacma fusca]